VAQAIVPWLHTAAVDPEGTSSDELDGPSIAACVGDLRRSGYDYVVVDGPPVLGSADANLLEQCADGVLVVLRAGRSRARDFRRAVDQLGTDRILGVVWLAS
jgi:Mrp family chromosome partitioning ATPase